MLGAQQEDRHLVAGHGSLGAVEADATIAGDVLEGELFDPGCGPVMDWDIVEARADSHGR